MANTAPSVNSNLVNDKNKLPHSTGDKPAKSNLASLGSEDAPIDVDSDFDISPDQTQSPSGNNMGVSQRYRTIQIMPSGAENNITNLKILPHPSKAGVCYLSSTGNNTQKIFVSSATKELKKLPALNVNELIKQGKLIKVNGTTFQILNNKKQNVIISPKSTPASKHENSYVVPSSAISVVSSSSLAGAVKRIGSSITPGVTMSSVSSSMNQSKITSAPIAVTPSSVPVSLSQNPTKLTAGTTPLSTISKSQGGNATPIAATNCVQIPLIVRPTLAQSKLIGSPIATIPSSSTHSNVSITPVIVRPTLAQSKMIGSPIATIPTSLMQSTVSITPVNVRPTLAQSKMIGTPIATIPTSSTHSTVSITPVIVRPTLAQSKMIDTFVLNPPASLTLSKLPVTPIISRSRTPLVQSNLSSTQSKIIGSPIGATNKPSSAQSKFSVTPVVVRPTLAQAKLIRTSIVSSPSSLAQVGVSSIPVIATSSSLTQQSKLLGAPVMVMPSSLTSAQSKIAGTLKTATPSSTQSTISDNPIIASSLMQPVISGGSVILAPSSLTSSKIAGTPVMLVSSSLTSPQSKATGNPIMLVPSSFLPMQSKITGNPMMVAASSLTQSGGNFMVLPQSVQQIIHNNIVNVNNHQRKEDPNKQCMKDLLVRKIKSLKTANGTQEKNASAHQSLHGVATPSKDILHQGLTATADAVTLPSHDDSQHSFFQVEDLDSVAANIIIDDDAMTSDSPELENLQSDGDKNIDGLSTSNTAVSSNTSSRVNDNNPSLRSLLSKPALEAFDHETNLDLITNSDLTGSGDYGGECSTDQSPSIHPENYYTSLQTMDQGQSVMVMKPVLDSDCDDDDDDEGGNFTIAITKARKTSASSHDLHDKSHSSSFKFETDELSPSNLQIQSVFSLVNEPEHIDFDDSLNATGEIENHESDTDTDNELHININDNKIKTMLDPCLVVLPRLNSEMLDGVGDGAGLLAEEYSHEALLCPVECEKKTACQVDPKKTESSLYQSVTKEIQQGLNYCNSSSLTNTTSKPSEAKEKRKSVPDFSYRNVNSNSCSHSSMSKSKIDAADELNEAYEFEVKLNSLSKQINERRQTLLLRKTLRHGVPLHQPLSSKLKQIVRQNTGEAKCTARKSIKIKRLPIVLSSLLKPNKNYTQPMITKGDQIKRKSLLENELTKTTSNYNVKNHLSASKLLHAIKHQNGRITVVNRQGHGTTKSSESQKKDPKPLPNKEVYKALKSLSDYLKATNQKPNGVLFVMVKNDGHPVLLKVSPCALHPESLKALQGKEDSAPFVGFGPNPTHLEPEVVQVERQSDLAQHLFNTQIPAGRAHQLSQSQSSNSSTQKSLNVVSFHQATSQIESVPRKRGRPRVRTGNGKSPQSYPASESSQSLQHVLNETKRNMTSYPPSTISSVKSTNLQNVAIRTQNPEVSYLQIPKSSQRNPIIQKVRTAQQPIIHPSRVTLSAPEDGSGDRRMSVSLEPPSSSSSTPVMTVTTNRPASTPSSRISSSISDSTAALLSCTLLTSPFFPMPTFSSDSPSNTNRSMPLVKQQIMKRSSNSDCSAEEKSAKRRRLEKKYPLPPGVIIKCEPDDDSNKNTEYDLDSNWEVTSDIQTGFVMSGSDQDFPSTSGTNNYVESDVMATNTTNEEICDSNIDIPHTNYNQRNLQDTSNRNYDDHTHDNTDIDDRIDQDSTSHDDSALRQSSDTDTVPSFVPEECDTGLREEEEIDDEPPELPPIVARVTRANKSKGKEVLKSLDFDKPQKKNYNSNARMLRSLEFDQPKKDYNTTRPSNRNSTGTRDSCSTRSSTDGLCPPPLPSSSVEKEPESSGEIEVPVPVPVSDKPPAINAFGKMSRIEQLKALLKQKEQGVANILNRKK